MSKMEVVKESDNKLLGRKEVLVQFETEGSTHAREKVKEEIAKKFKVKENLVVVNSIKSHYGSLNVLVSANVYDKKETLERLTSKHIADRNSKGVSKEEKSQTQEGEMEEENASNRDVPSEESSDEGLKESNDSEEMGKGESDNVEEEDKNDKV